MYADAQALFRKGLQALEQNNTPVALTCFEKACDLDNSPVASSYFAYCLAKERGQIKRAILICEEALKTDPNNTTLYFNLGRIYILAGDKAKALRLLRQSLDLGDDPQIIAELNRMGTRKPPVISSLSRENPINKYLGILLGKLGLR